MYLTTAELFFNILFIIISFPCKCPYDNHDPLKIQRMILNITSSLKNKTQIYPKNVSNFLFFN